MKLVLAGFRAGCYLVLAASLYGQTATYYNDGAASSDAVTLQGWAVTDVRMSGNPAAIHHSQSKATIKSPTGRTNVTIVGGSTGPASTRADTSISTLDEVGDFTLTTVHDGWCQYGGHFLTAVSLTRVFSGGVITSSYVKVGDYGDGTASYDKNCQAGIDYSRTCGDGTYRLAQPGTPHSFAHMPFYFISIGTNSWFKCAGPGSPQFDSGPPRCRQAP